MRTDRGSPEEDRQTDRHSFLDTSHSRPPAVLQKQRRTDSHRGQGRRWSQRDRGSVAQPPGLLRRDHWPRSHPAGCVSL